MFAWYDKHRRLQYCLCSDASGRLYRARLAWPDGTVLQVHRAWQGMVLGIAFDLSALPYLLRLIPGPSPSGRPRSVVFSGPRPCQPGKSCKQRSSVSWSEKEVGVRLCPHLDQVFWSGTGSFSRPVIRYLGQPGRHALSLRRLLGRVFARKRAHWGPRVYEPDKHSSCFRSKTIFKPIHVHNTLKAHFISQFPNRQRAEEETIFEISCFFVSNA